MSVLRDVAYAFRQIRRKPTLPIVVVISLGLAMGISTSLFSVVNAAWFTPWQVPNPGELRVFESTFSAAEVRTWAKDTRAFQAIAAERLAVYRMGRQVEYVRTVSRNYFDVLRVPIAIGHNFAPGREGVVISDQVWRRQFGRNVDILGTVIRLDPVDVRGGTVVSAPIIGVAAPGFNGPGLGFPTGIWLPLSDTSTASVGVFGRLAPTTSDKQAESEISTLSRQFHTDQNPQAPIALHTTDQYSQMRGMTPQLRAMWESLLAGIVFITFIACANVSNLLLALGLSRRAEIALRLAIGASRTRTVQQLLTETLILSIAAGGMGLAIAGWLPNEIIRVLPGTSVEDLFRVPVDYRVFLWSLAVSLIACFAFGLVPALRSTEGSLSEALKEGQANGRKALMPALLSYQTIVSAAAAAIWPTRRALLIQPQEALQFE